MHLGDNAPNASLERLDNMGEFTFGRPSTAQFANLRGHLFVLEIKVALTLLAHGCGSAFASGKVCNQALQIVGTKQPDAFMDTRWLKRGLRHALYQSGTMDAPRDGRLIDCDFGLFEHVDCCC